MDLEATQPEAGAIPRREPLPRQWNLKFSILWLFLFALLGFGVYHLRYHLRSYSLLIRFLNPQASGPLLRWETAAVTTQEVTMPTANGPVRARLYLPTGVTHPPGMVVAHGVHHLGIDEPRLMSFARAAAGGGFAVLTPQIPRLANLPSGCSNIWAQALLRWLA